MGNRTSKRSKYKAEKQVKSGKKGRKIKQNAASAAEVDANPDMLNSPTDMEDDIPLIESVSAPLIAEIEEAYDLKQNGGFKRLFHCVTSSLVWLSTHNTKRNVTVFLTHFLHNVEILDTADPIDGEVPQVSICSICKSQVWHTAFVISIYIAEYVQLT